MAHVLKNYKAVADKYELERLIGTCEYHARKAADKHDFFVAKSQAAYRVEAAKNTLEWAALMSDVAQQLKILLKLQQGKQPLSSPSHN